MAFLFRLETDYGAAADPARFETVERAGAPATRSRSEVRTLVVGIRDDADQPPV
jgi:hypothetical protein